MGGFSPATVMGMTHSRRKVKVEGMIFQGAVVKEQGVTFGIIIVKPHVLQNENDKAQMQQFGCSAFGRMPIVLMAQDFRGIPTYYGRKDIVNFLSHVTINRIPWKEYSVA